jgi:hypothetical protein
MACELGLDGTEIRKIAGFPSGDLTSCDDQTCDQLCQRLKDGQVQRAKSLIQSIYLSGCNAASLADHLIRPVMGRIGHGWMVGALDVYQEHQATHIVAATVLELIDQVSRERKPTGPLALGATTEGGSLRPFLPAGRAGTAGDGLGRAELGRESPLAVSGRCDCSVPSQAGVSVNQLPAR